MHSIKSLFATLAGVLLFVVPAHAAFITGTFSGLAANSERVQGVEMFGNFDGARIFGSFGFETEPGGSSGPAWLNFEVPGIVTYDFTSGTGALFSSSGTTRTIDISHDNFTPEPSGHLIITGPASSLDPFDPGAILLEYFSGHFGARRGPTADIVFDRFAFDAPPNSIPEPATLALFGMGLLCVASLGRRRRGSR